MSQYHKIQSIFKRDLNTGKFLPEHSRPEFEWLKGAQWQWHEKIDGMNIRVEWMPGMEGGLGAVTFNGRTDRAQLPPGLLGRLQALFPVAAFEGSEVPLVLYGEGVGGKIQGTGMQYVPGGGYDFILFDVRVVGKWLPQDEVTKVAEKFSVRRAPLVEGGTLEQAIDWVQDHRVAQPMKWRMEGLILRPLVELQNQWGERVITKVKVRDYVATPASSSPCSPTP